MKETSERDSFKKTIFIILIVSSLLVVIVVVPVVLITNKPDTSQTSSNPTAQNLFENDAESFISLGIGKNV